MTASLRVLFCITVTQSFFDLPQADVPGVFQAFGSTLADLQEGFDVRLIGTMDDDRLRVGVSAQGHPTAYILADVPDLETVGRVCDLFRSTPVGEHLMWRYGCIEARIGRQASGFDV